MLHGSEIWCLKEKEMAILQRNERAMCGVQLFDGYAGAGGISWQWSVVVCTCIEEGYGTCSEESFNV